MKKLVLVLQLLAFTLLSRAQAPNWLWAESSQGGYYEYVAGLWTDTASNVYLTGRISGTINFGGASVTAYSGEDPFVAQFDSAGNNKWFAHDTYDGFDYTWGTCKDAKNNVYSAGYYVEKYNSAGTKIWGFSLPGSGGIAGMGLAVDNSGNVYMTGAIQGNVTLGSVTLNYSGSGQDIYLVKMDSDGNFLWGVTAGGGSGYDVGRGIAVDNTGSHVYIIGGYTDTPTFGTITAPAPSGYSDFFIAEYDTSGNALNVVAVPNAGIENGDCCQLDHITIDSCDNIYVGGYFENTATFGNFSLTSAGGKDVFIAKCNSNFVWQWANSIGGTSDEYENTNINLDKNSDVYVGGYYSSSTINLGDSTLSGGNSFVAKYANSSGALLWAQSAVTPSGGAGGIGTDNKLYTYVAGNFYPTGTFGTVSISAANNTNIYLAKLDTVPQRIITPVISSPYCAGSTVNLPYTLVGNFITGNAFTAQLSDSTGSFANPTNIGSVNSTANGIISITIPSGTPSGSDYLIRIISSDPPASSYASGCVGYFINNVYYNGFYVTISNSLQNISVSPADTAVCIGASLTLSATGGGSYTWNNGDTGSTILVTPTVDTTYRVQVNNGGCSGSDSVKVTISPSGAVGLYPASPTICAGQSILLTANGYTNYTWSPTTGLNSTTGDSVTATPTVSTTYTVNANNISGCSATALDTVTVVPVPNTPTVSQSGDTLKSSAETNNQWYENGKLISGATGQDLIIGKSTDTFTVVVVNPADGCSSSSAPLITSGITQLSINNNQVSIFPNPTNGNITLDITSAITDIGDWNLRLTDVLGQTIYTRNSLDYNNVIDLSHLAGGVYFITVTNKTGEGVFKVMKQ